MFNISATRAFLTPRKTCFYVLRESVTRQIRHLVHVGQILKRQLSCMRSLILSTIVQNQDQFLEKAYCKAKVKFFSMQFVLIKCSVGHKLRVTASSTLPCLKADMREAEMCGLFFKLRQVMYVCTKSGQFKMQRSKNPEKHAVEINSLLFNTLLSHSPFKEDKLYNI